MELNRGDGTFQQTYVRHDIWGLEAAGPWDPVTLAYASAVKAMQARPLTDPTSWRYQAAIHGDEQRQATEAQSVPVLIGRISVFRG